MTSNTFQGSGNRRVRRCCHCQVMLSLPLLWLQCPTTVALTSSACRLRCARDVHSALDVFHSAASLSSIWAWKCEHVGCPGGGANISNWHGRQAPVPCRPLSICIPVSHIKAPEGKCCQSLRVTSGWLGSFTYLYSPVRGRPIECALSRPAPHDILTSSLYLVLCTDMLHLRLSTCEM